MYKNIARLMAFAAKEFVIPNIDDVIKRPYSHIYIESRAGSGKKTYHCRISDRKSILVFGKKMIESKLSSYSTACRWLTGREMLKKGYQGGVITPQNILIHTVLHEVAHFIQVVEGGRKYNSVHNDAFYDALDRIYTSKAYPILRDFMMSSHDFASLKFKVSKEECEIIEEEKKKGMVGPSDVNKGDVVTFIVKGGNYISKRAVRVNKKTVTVKLCNRNVYVPYIFIRHVNRVA